MIGCSRRSSTVDDDGPRFTENVPPSRSTGKVLFIKRLIIKANTSHFFSILSIYTLDIFVSSLVKYGDFIILWHCDYFCIFT